MNHILYFAKKIHAFSGKILYFNLIGMILISLFESVGIFLLIPLLGLTGMVKVNSESTSSFSWINGLFKDIPNTLSLPLILGIYIFLIIGQSYFQSNQKLLNIKIQQSFTRHLREETYKLLLQANWGFFLRKRKSDIINNLTAEIGRVSGGTNMFLQFITSLVFTFIQVVVAFWLSPTMTVSILILGFALIFFSRRFINKANQVGSEATELSKTYLSGITDQFNGIKDIKSNSLEEPHLNWFYSISQRLEQNILDFVKVSIKSQFIYKVVSAFLIALFVFLAVSIYKAQTAQLMLIVIIFSRIWPRLSGIQANLEQLGSIVPSFKVLLDFQKECLLEKELHNGNYNNNQPLRVKERLECNHVFFRYNRSLQSYALKDINVQIPVNSMTAIVGRSGAGKSTLIDLFMGLNQPEKGEVLIDGVPFTKHNLLSLRKSISYVPQDPFLFNTSIKENLQLIDPHATEAQIWEALEFSSAAEFVRKLPQGLDTLIGDRGIRLSGGERQRIVLARAILRKPSILVLDEATSALDTENEAKIQLAIDHLKGSMTIIVIAHRLSTIRNADQVIVIDQGSVVQSGKFNQLAKERRSVFGHLLSNQTEVSNFN